jgi:hypothetical protein
MAAEQNRTDKHSIACGVAANVRDNAMAVATTEAQRTTAQINYYKSVLASGRAEGLATGAVAALARLGYTVSDLRSGDT